MMTLVNMDSTGLVVLPTHRVVFGLEGFDLAAILDRLQKYFEVEKLEVTGDLAQHEQDSGNWTEPNCDAGNYRDSCFLLRHASTRNPVRWRQSEQQRALDVVQLHKLMLEETSECLRQTFATKST